MSERMKWREAEAVVRAYRAEHGAADVDVATLARALGTDEAEVRRLAGRKRRFADASGVMSAAIALTVAVMAILAVGPSIITKNPLVASLLPAPKPVAVDVYEFYPGDSELAIRIDRATHERIVQHEALLDSEQLAIADEEPPL